MARLLQVHTYICLKILFFNTYTFLLHHKYYMYVPNYVLGIGVSTLFSNGVVWIQSQLNFGSQVTALFIIACTIGAQVVKIPAVGK